MKKNNNCPAYGSFTPGSNAGSAQKAALLELQQLSFSLVDLNLYLDTNPDNQQAVSDYNQLFEQSWAAKSSYELQYGPMNNFGHCPATYPWGWINDPWPWERGGNV